MKKCKYKIKKAQHGDDIQSDLDSSLHKEKSKLDGTYMSLGNNLSLSGTGGLDDIFNLGLGIKNFDGINDVFGIVNPLARMATKTLNTINDAKNRNEEFNQYIRSIQQPAFENMNESGLNDLPIYTKYGGKNKYQIKEVGGVTENDFPIVEAEEGEVFTTQTGELQKVAEGAGTHEEGGVLLNNVERVLEDTSDKRKDKISQALKVSPELAKILADVETKVPLSHSKVMEKAKEQQSKDLNKLEKKLQNNVNSLKKVPTNKYAQNSMDMNLKFLNSLPSEKEIFDNLFDHQELVKAALGVKNNQKAKNGGKYSLPTAQIGADVKNNATLLNDTRGWEFIGKDANRSYYRKQNGEIVSTEDRRGSVVRGGNNFTAQDMVNNPVKYKTFHRLMEGASDEEKLAAAQKIITDNVWPTGYIANKNMYGYTEGSDYPMASDIPGMTKPIDFSIKTGNVPISPNVPKTGISAQPQQNQLTQQKGSEFFEPVRWYDVAGSMMQLMERRIPVKHNPAQVNQLRFKLQNPLPSLQNAQSDYNALLNLAGPTSVDFANVAQAFAKKYAIDNQILGQYENINTDIKNKEIAYNTAVQDKQSQLDQTAREVTERKYLGSLEAERQQKGQSWKELFSTLAANRKLNREGNLLMKLFPAFDQYGQYNNYKYTFRNPLTVPQNP